MLGGFDSDSTSGRLLCLRGLGLYDFSDSPLDWKILGFRISGGFDRIGPLYPKPREPHHPEKPEICQRRVPNSWKWYRVQVQGSRTLFHWVTEERAKSPIDKV